jgi:hypothetical protein
MDPRIESATNTLFEAMGLLSAIVATFVDPEGRIPDLDLEALKDRFEERLDRNDPAVQVALDFKHTLLDLKKALKPVM